MSPSSNVLVFVLGGIDVHSSLHGCMASSEAFAELNDKYSLSFET